MRDKWKKKRMRRLKRKRRKMRQRSKFESMMKNLSLMKMLRRCKSESTQLVRTFSYKSLRSQSARKAPQELDQSLKPSLYQTVFVGRTKKPYLISKQHLKHPLVNSLLEKQHRHEVDNDDDGSWVITVKCEVVLLDHLLWMLENGDQRQILESLDECDCSTTRKRLDFCDYLGAKMHQHGSAGQHCEFTAASYFSWPTSSRLSNAAEERANYFSNLQKEEEDEVSPEPSSTEPKGPRATTLLELMTIRAFHSKILRCYSLGTAIGFRIRRGVLTDIPAIIVFVSRKVHKQWLSPLQCLPTSLEGAGGIWCDVDVVEFSYFGEPDHQPTPKQTFTTEIVDHLQGSDPFIGSGSQVASQETCGTLGAIVRSQTGSRQVGFVTNRHVAVNLDYPSQKMFHPLPPALGPGVYLGAVERATSFITDDLWFGIFAGTNPETFVRADGAFIPFADDYDLSRVTTSVKGGVGEIGEVKAVELQSPVGSLVGKQVVKVGRSSGLTTGTVLAYALEYNDEKGVCFLTDFLVVGENHRCPFDLEGDSGSLIVMKGEDKARPIGIIWGGTGSRGRLKLKVGESPESWTTGVDLGRLLTHLQLDLITTDEGLQAAVQEQRAASTTGMSSMVADSSPPYVNFKREKRSPEEKLETSLGPLQVQHIDLEERIETKGGAPSVEHQFMPSFSGQCSASAWPETAREDFVARLTNGGCDGDLCVGLRLGDDGAKRRRSQVTKDRMRPAE